MKKIFALAICFLFFGITDEVCAAAREIHTAGKRQVMLTIDDGPRGVLVDEMLSVLREKKVKATFFLLGQDAELHSGDVKKIANEGHIIANHADTHQPLRGMPYEQILDELRRCNDTLEKITGKRPRFMRPPHGEYDAEVLRACEAEGLAVVFWKNNPGDYKGDTASVLAQNVIRARKDGDIILLHLGLQNTIDALPTIIDSYKKVGFKFVTPEDARK